MVLAICSVVGVPPAGRLPVSLLMAAALVPWVVRSVAGRHITALSGVTLAAVGLVNVGGWSWGWLEADAGSQMSLLLALWLVLCDAVVETLWPPLLETVALTGIVLASAAPTSWGSAIIWIPGIVLVFGGGRLLHSMAWTIVRVRAAEAQLAQQAVAVEQRRIAREVHDVVAHSLSVTALQLTAARMAADRGDLDATRAALDDAERLTRASLGDLRGTVRLLREATALDAGAGADVGEHLPVPAALPGLDELSGLVASFRSAGMDVTVRQRPRPGAGGGPARRAGGVPGGAGGAHERRSPPGVPGRRRHGGGRRRDRLGRRGDDGSSDGRRRRRTRPGGHA